jgi:hypothetical protein
MYLSTGSILGTKMSILVSGGAKDQNLKWARSNICFAPYVKASLLAYLSKINEIKSRKGRKDGGKGPFGDTLSGQDCIGPDFRRNHPNEG